MFLNDSVPTLLVRMQCFLGTFPPKWLEVGRSTDAYFTGKQQVFEIDQNSQQIMYGTVLSGCQIAVTW